MQRQDLFISLLLFLFSAALYCWSMPQSITLIDAGLFQMVCDANGLAHPSGFPIATLACHGLSYLPFEGVIPGNLLSVIFGSLTVIALYFTALQLRLTRTYAASAAVLLACSTHYWSQAIIIEVYTLNSFLLLCAFYFALRYNQNNVSRDLYISAFFLGTGLANHWPLIVVSTPALAALVIYSTASLRQLFQPRHVLLGSLSIIVGLSPYLLLLTKNDNSMLIHGPINSLEQFVHYIARTAYDDTFLNQSERTYSYLWRLPFESIQTFGYAAWLLIPIGLVRSFHQLKTNHAIALVALWVANCLLLPLLTDYPYSYEMRSIVITWTLLAHISCALWMAIGLQAIGSWVGGIRWSGQAASAVSILLVLLISAPFNYRAQDHVVDHYGRTLLMSLDENAILFVRSDNQTGPLGYLHYVEGVRPDIDIYNLDSVLFDNRLTPIQASEEAKADTILQFIKHATRPVYSIAPLPLPAEDHGFYFKYNSSTPGFYRTIFVDEYFANLISQRRDSGIKDPRTRVLMDSLIYDYARLVIGLGIVGTNHSPEFIDLLGKMTATLQGKIWTLHHVLASPSPDKAVLLSLALAAELQISEEVTAPARAKLYRHIAEVWMLAPSDTDQALHYYALATRTKDQNICQSASTRLPEPYLRRLNCIDQENYSE
ncbi:MAG: hypothetical protein ACI9XK_004248 [Granulosicoccus sp.]|jgi:hypothetical protein